MCYTQTASALLAIGAFAIAAYEHKTFGCWQYTIGLAYFGLMEGLQAVQHSYLAVPDDGYAMCQDPTNQILTFLGGLHICFQPLFVNFTLMGNYRMVNLRDRIESEIVQKLCLLAGLWMTSRYFYAILYPDNPLMASTPTEACPNYEWLAEGYDPHMKFQTPNLPGTSCTYLSPSDEGHLAWAMPLYQATYFMPGTSIHFFLMFGPYVLMTRRPFVMFVAVLMFLTGPLLASYLTPALNEQPAIWCFKSVTQIFFSCIFFRLRGKLDEIPTRIESRGGIGEKLLVYQRVAGETSSYTKLLSVDSD